MFLRILRFPLTLLVLEAAAVIGSAAAFSVGMKQLGLIDHSPRELLLMLGYAVALVLLWKALRRWLEGSTDQEFARPAAVPELLCGLAIGTAVFAAAVGIVALLGGFEILGLRGQGALWSMLTIAVFSGMFEELLLRGIFLRHLEAMLGTWAALGISAALFGAAHLTNPGATVFAAFAIAMEAGILLGAAYLLTRRLWLAIGIHAAWNFTQGWVFSIPISGGPAPLGLLITRRVGPDWLTGGDFGLEASVIALVVATGAGLAMLVLAVRRGRMVVPMWRRAKAAQIEPSAVLD